MGIKTWLNASKFLGTQKMAKIRSPKKQHYHMWLKTLSIISGGNTQLGTN
jgi:hypothetical protein